MSVQVIWSSSRVVKEYTLVRILINSNFSALSYKQARVSHEFIVELSDVYVYLFICLSSMSYVDVIVFN
jgi:hypothetical protein